MGRIMVAIYLRLSNEDRNKGKGEESDSISAQRALLTRHTEELMRGREYGITEFCDDGYSGVDFRRPGVQALIEAAKSGDIHMIVVKDDCVIIELNAKSPIKCGFCAVSSIF